MSELVEKLAARATELEKTVKKNDLAEIREPLEKLRDAANQIGRAWGGSWIGYQSRVYYEGLVPPPPGANFSSEWGFQDTFVENSQGNWAEYTFDGVRDAIFVEFSAGVTSLEKIEKISKQAKDAFLEAREDFLSVAVVSLENKSDAFLSRLKQQVEQLKVTSKFEFIKAVQPKQLWSRDSLAMSQGMQVPPHIAVIAEIAALKNPMEQCAELVKLLQRAVAHLDTRGRHRQEKRSIGTNVFIGHGRSFAWRDLKDFIQDRIGLPWDEFNRVPVAGITNITRLSQMLEDAAIAFIILTAEDEQADAKMHPRMNVVHEAGLFQGKLGFTRAIVLLEEGCEEFSNIQGLGQIRFPKGNIKAIFEEIRRVLEREGLIES